MKKLLLFFALPLILISCSLPSDKANFTDLGKLLAGNHELNKLPLKVDPTQGQQNTYFIVKDAGKTLTFAWQLPDSSFVISSIELNKVRLKFDPLTEIPVIKFRWQGQNSIDLDQAFTSGYIKYIIVTCKESDFPFQIPTN